MNQSRETKSKHKELELRQIQQRYTALVDAFAAAIVQLNGDGHIEYASDYLSELSGRPIESAMGDGWHKAIHPEDLPKILQHMAELSEGPANQERVADGIQARLLRPDGSLNWVQPKLRLRYGSDGKLSSIIAVLIDIDEHRELEQKQALLAAIVEATPDLIGVSNPQREILYHNKTATELLPELSNPENRTNFIDAHPPWVQKIILEEAIPAATEHGSWTGETAILGDDGKEYPVSQVFIAHKDPDGTLESFSTIIRDISEQKAVEQALRESERKFASLAAAAPAGFFRIVDGNNCVYVNQRWADITGRSVEEALGQKWMQCIHPDDLPVRQQEIESFLADDSRTIYEPTEKRLVLPDGTLRRVVVHLAKELDESGNVAGLVGTLTDVTERREVELALSQSEEKFKRIVEGVADVLWSMDSKGILTYLSPRFESMFGLNPADWIGKTPFDLVHPDERSELEQLANEQLEEGSTRRNVEFRHICADGSYLWVALTAAPVMDEEGRITGFHGVLRDISKRKAVEFALQESDQRFASLAATTQAGIFRMNNERECVYVNERWGELTGRPIEEALGQSWMSSVHADDFEWMQEETRAFIADDTRHVDDPKEVRHVLPDGSPSRVLLHLAKEKDEQGNVTGLVGTLTDIEKTRAVEDALLESETKFQRVVEQVPGMVFRLKMRADGSDELLYVNSGIRDVFELEPEEALKDASNVWGRIHRDDVEHVAAEFAEAAKSIDFLAQEFRLELPGKGVRWVQTTSHRTLENNGDVIWDGIVIDQTDRKMAELALQSVNAELEKATKMKDEFLANMSHELRTPLSAILTTSEALEGGAFGPVTPDQKEGYDVIQKSGEHLLSLIDEVLDLAKIESGFVDLEIAAVDIQDLCQSSLELIAQQAEKKNIELNLSIPFGLPELAADEKRMRQILVNLLSNAVKFTPAGGKVSVYVQREKTGESEETLRIVVSDTGIGIDPGQQDSLFEPFVQADSSLSRSYEGTGLGLALVKRFVELHSGNVSVTSEVGVGSCFTVEMPYPQTFSAVTTPPDSLQDTDQSNKQSLPVTYPSQLPHPISARILLAEDNEMAAFSITRNLKRMGFHVELVSNGQAAVEAVHKSVPDIILMDVQMPVMDGLEATKKIREITGLEKVPIIALTGLVMPEDINRCLRAGANKHMSKPFGLQELINSIGEFVPNVIR